MKTPYHYKNRQLIPYERDTVFEFFSNPENLERLTPDRLQFNILTDTPINITEGTTIEYALKIRGIPFRWISRITEWSPPDYFVDVQEKGPYKSWKHTHRFYDRNGNTEIVDEVEYRVPGWIFAPLIHCLFVRKDIERIFEYRTETLKEIFPEKN